MRYLTKNTNNHQHVPDTLKIFLKSSLHLSLLVFIVILVLPVISYAQTRTVVAGDGTFGFSGDGGLATDAQIANSTWTVTIDNSGNLFIADQGNHRIRRVDAITGIITTVAGDGGSGFSGDDGLTLATDASISNPYGVAVDSAGNLFFADLVNDRIRRVDAVTDIITTVVGTGTPGSSGDAGPAALAQLNSPAGIAMDSAGNLFIADSANNRIRRVDASTGNITAVAGNGGLGFSGDGGPATNASFFFPYGVAVDSNGNLFIADTFNNRIRRVDGNTGVITTIVNSPGFVFDLSVDNAGNVFYVIRDHPSFPSSEVWKWDAPTGPETLFSTVHTGLGISVDGSDVYVTTSNSYEVYKYSDNQPPVADAGPDQTVECTSPSGASVTLDGSGSTDPDEDSLTYTWDGPFGMTTGVSPTVNMPMNTSPTIANVTLTVSDGTETDTDDVFITVQDTTAPKVRAKLKKKKKGCFRVEFSATDICDADPTVVALLNGVSVTNGQLVKLIHDGDDDSSSDNNKVTFKGSKFTLKVTATDDSGNVGTKSDTFVFPSKRCRSDDRKLKKKLKKLKKKWRKRYSSHNNSNGCKTWNKWSKWRKW
ncbi:MAG: hypothetical protein H8D23_08000 [Candidatus Brocadiales bacterium]|nr:hypothetical protein [Candidatus Brocadiales bacterium]